VEPSVLPFDNHKVPTPLLLPSVCLSDNSFWQHQATTLTLIILSVVDMTPQDFHVFSIEANDPWHREQSLKAHWQANISFEGN